MELQGNTTTVIAQVAKIEVGGITYSGIEGYLDSFERVLTITLMDGRIIELVLRSLRRQPLTI